MEARIPQSPLGQGEPPLVAGSGGQQSPQRRNWSPSGDPGSETSEGSREVLPVPLGPGGHGSQDGNMSFAAAAAGSWFPTQSPPATRNKQAISRNSDPADPSPPPPPQSFGGGARFPHHSHLMPQRGQPPFGMNSQFTNGGVPAAQQPHQFPFSSASAPYPFFPSGASPPEWHGGGRGVPPPPPPPPSPGPWAASHSIPPPPPPPPDRPRPADASGTGTSSEGPTTRSDYPTSNPGIGAVSSSQPSLKIAKQPADGARTSQQQSSGQPSPASGGAPPQSPPGPQQQPSASPGTSPRASVSTSGWSPSPGSGSASHAAAPGQITLLRRPQRAAAGRLKQTPDASVGGPSPDDSCSRCTEGASGGPGGEEAVVAGGNGGSEPTNVKLAAGEGGGSAPAAAIKTLEEREHEYNEARKRIFGAEAED